MDANAKQPDTLDAAEAEQAAQAAPPPAALPPLGEDEAETYVALYVTIPGKGPFKVVEPRRRSAGAHAGPMIARILADAQQNLWETLRHHQLVPDMSFVEAVALAEDVAQEGDIVD